MHLTGMEISRQFRGVTPREACFWEKSAQWVSELSCVLFRNTPDERGAKHSIHEGVSVAYSVPTPIYVTGIMQTLGLEIPSECQDDHSAVPPSLLRMTAMHLPV